MDQIGLFGYMRVPHLMSILGVKRLLLVCVDMCTATQKLVTLGIIVT
jgi:hypothetical protein